MPAGRTGWEAYATLSMKSFWLVKQEPSSYSWSDFVAEGQTSWTGVRNYTARNNLRKMRKGDDLLFYHSGEEKAVVGMAKVTRPAYPDPTATGGDWSAVNLAPINSCRWSQRRLPRRIRSLSPCTMLPPTAETSRKR